MIRRYIVLAKRPSKYGPDGFDYQAAGGIWPIREPVSYTHLTLPTNREV